MAHENTLTKLGTKENPVHITTLQSYAKCPAKFKYQFEEDVQKSASIFLIGGTAVHDSISEVLRSNWNIPLTKWQNERELFTDVWMKTIMFNEKMGRKLEMSDGEIKKAFDDYEEMFLEFYYREKDRKRINPIWSEAKFSLNIPHWDPDHDPIFIRGTVDLIAEVDGKLALLDFKSNRAEPEHEELARNLQFGCYYLAMKNAEFENYNNNNKIFKIDKFPEELYWYQLRYNMKYKRNSSVTSKKQYQKGDYKGEPLILTRRFPEQEQAIVKEVQMRLRAIQNEIFFMEFHPYFKCSSCDMKEVCDQKQCVNGPTVQKNMQGNLDNFNF